MNKANEKNESAVGNVVQVSEFTCVACSAVVTTKIPELRLLNTPEFSSVTLVHQFPIKCECGVYYIPLLRKSGMQLGINWQKVEVQKDNIDSTIKSTPEQKTSSVLKQ